MPRPPRTIDACPHPDRPHYSGGKCKSCYYKDRRAQGLSDRANSDAKYAQSDEGKERAKRYDQTDAGRERKRKWKRDRKAAAPKIRLKLKAIADRANNLCSHLKLTSPAVIWAPT